MDKFKPQDGTTISAILWPIIYKQETADEVRERHVYLRIKYSTKLYFP